MNVIAVIENNIIATNSIREALMKALVDKGFKIIILTSGNSKDIQTARQKGFEVIDIGSSVQNPVGILNYMRNLKKALKKIKPDVCLTFTIRPAIWGNIVTRSLKIPTITNITGIGPLFERKNIAYKAARLLYKFVLQKTSKIFFQNYDDMNIFLEKKFVSPGVVERIPGSGIDHNFYSPGNKNNSSGKFKFLFISRLVKDKGITEYVTAAEIIKNEIDAEYQVLGPLWLQNLKDNTVQENELQQWIDAGTIKYFGEAKDVRNYIADADCIVLPSYREGTSNVLLEASSMEKPCITTDTTGCRDIIADGVTGFLCKVKNANDLAEKMKKMFGLTEAERLAMGKKGREKVIKEYDKQIVIDAYVKAINKITGKDIL